MLNKIREAKKESKGINTAGFTIIEVMIVLAIAGLIMAIVFLAIPGLQRSNRNTQRKSDASRLSGLISEFVANNNGNLPTQFASGSGYLDISAQKWNILAPVTGALGAVPGAVTPPISDTMVVYYPAVCGATPGDAPTATGATSRQYVVYWFTEGSPGTQCLGS